MIDTRLYRSAFTVVCVVFSERECQVDAGVGPTACNFIGSGFHSVEPAGVIGFIVKVKAELFEFAVSPVTFNA